MKNMGWDWETYLQQPNEWVILIQEFMRIENG